ncbi:hypothetical protein MLD38_012485 [Melastoma candidum]|nr:hypothetical protein MLD38_012485 [Melastoma candidum]
MARTSQDLASSKRHHHFPWPNPTSSINNKNDEVRRDQAPHNDPSGGPASPDKPPRPPAPPPLLSKSNSTKKPRSVSLSRIQAAFLTTLLLSKNKAAGLVPSRSPHLPLLGRGCRRAVGTLFGRRKGHVQFTLQRDAGSRPAFFVELSTPIDSLVKEMASGLVRIALECDKSRSNGSGGGASNRGVRLLEEPAWKAYCNGKKCGFATRKECGDQELRILKAIEPISMGAGVLPRVEGDEDDNNRNGSSKDDDETNNANGEGELMYMRAKFERIVGSRDCEAYYMMNPDSNGAPELSIYLLRV